MDRGVLNAILEARTLMLREIAGLAAQRRSAPQAQRLEDLAGDLRQATDAHAAAHVDFAFFTEVADAAGNLVFVLILNAIRRLYFDHLAAVPVTSDPAALAPHYARVARAIARQDARAARAAAATAGTNAKGNALFLVDAGLGVIEEPVSAS